MVWLPHVASVYWQNHPNEGNKGMDPKCPSEIGPPNNGRIIGNYVMVVNGWISGNQKTDSW